jgi:hypothetical protein
MAPEEIQIATLAPITAFFSMGAHKNTERVTSDVCLKSEKDCLEKTKRSSNTENFFYCGRIFRIGTQETLKNIIIHV